ncbi:uncharacterized protein apof [Hypomesus transpacificus]|uniref:uncharacterized protein apof n=1 Tax=Hypomesus transpacificus TaxID=137520 RepID=UPI001F08192E|nr:uncharacterized protein apof [Hypomesus transpacificus]
MLHYKMKWLILVQLLLAQHAFCRAPPPPVLSNSPLPSTPVLEEGDTTKQSQRSLLDSQIHPNLSKGVQEEAIHAEDRVQWEDKDKSAQRILATFRAKFQGRIHIQGNASCEELLSASNPSSALFPRELLGLSLVPVLVVADCPREAHTLVLWLYKLLGVEDTEQLLLELESLMEKGVPRPRASPAPSSPVGQVQAERHLQAVMFNIQQLAKAGRRQGSSWWGKKVNQCYGWTKVNGTLLLGYMVEGSVGALEVAVRACESLGAQCAGVSRGGALDSGHYQAVMKLGSWVVPTEHPDSESWIRQCRSEEGEALSASSGRRARRSSHRDCVDKQEQRVYNVVEWIPAVSTLYNLGTAVYYASVNCSETAKERAILSAVDLGTDALMAVTGGTAGVAGYALGAGVKTGVKAGIKYLLSSMKHEEDDLMVNQYSWEEGVITMQ